MGRFDEAIAQLEANLERIAEAIRETNGAAELVTKKKQLQDALRCLRFCDQNALNPPMQAFVLPEIAAGYSDFRVIIDNESDHRELWEEVCDVDGSPLRLGSGDVLLLKA